MTYIPTEELLALLDKVIDDAISEGRANYDSYYGVDNSMHMAEVKASDPYKILVREISRPREKAP